MSILQRKFTICDVDFTEEDLLTLFREMLAVAQTEKSTRGTRFHINADLSLHLVGTTTQVKAAQAAELLLSIADILGDMSVCRVTNGVAIHFPGKLVVVPISNGLIVIPTEQHEM